MWTHFFECGCGWMVFMTTNSEETIEDTISVKIHSSDKTEFSSVLITIQLRVLLMSDLYCFPQNHLGEGRKERRDRVGIPQEMNLIV